MQLFLKRFHKHKKTYLFLIIALCIIQGVVLFGYAFGKNFKSKFSTDSVFDIENLYQLEVLVMNLTNQKFEPIEISESLIRSIEKIPGVKFGCKGMPDPLQRNSARFFFPQGYFMPSTAQKLSGTKGEEDMWFVPVWVSSGFHRVFEVQFTAGKFFDAANSSSTDIIISESLAQRMGVKEKSLPREIILPADGDKTEKLTVCGIVKDIEYVTSGDDKLAYACFRFSADQKNAVLELQSGANINTLSEEIEEVVSMNQGKPVQIRIASLESVVGLWFKRNIHEYLPVLWLIPIVVVYSLLALFGLFWNDIKSRKTDFGIMQAIGIRSILLYKSIVIESVCLVVMASSITGFILISTGEMVKRLFMINSGHSIISYWLISVAMTLAIVLFASLIPALQVFKMSPVKALSE